MRKYRERENREENGLEGLWSRDQRVTKKGGKQMYVCKEGDERLNEMWRGYVSV